jgi:hypothetical protein
MEKINKGNNTLTLRAQAFPNENGPGLIQRLNNEVKKRDFYQTTSLSIKDLVQIQSNSNNLMEACQEGMLSM